ncbi:hypothetical protein D9M69_573780 [compost metagenome]
MCRQPTGKLLGCPRARCRQVDEHPDLAAVADALIPQSNLEHDVGCRQAGEYDLGPICNFGRAVDGGCTQSDEAHHRTCVEIKNCQRITCFYQSGSHWFAHGAQAYEANAWQAHSLLPLLSS